MQFHALKVALGNLQISILLSINANLRFFQELFPLPPKQCCAKAFTRITLFFLVEIRSG